jgi:pilus assembly protein FimV
LPEPGFIDTLLENPLLPAGAAGLIALLAGLGFYKARQRKKAAQLDSAFVESKLRPESFSGASGGQSVDTSDNLTTGSSMVYSPSQLDAVDDVDPVAEADVYLAYGRDLQAEEILKDALRTNPQRVAIHQKLLEIYAKRRDAKAFEAIAALAFNLTDGTGSEWEQICEKGLSIDPDNALYLPGGQPLAELNSPTIPAAMESPSDSLAAEIDPDATAVPPPPADGAIDLDLDLDFSLEEPVAPPPETDIEEPELEIPDFSFNTNELAQPLPTISEDMLPPVDALLAESEQETAPGALGDKLDFSVPIPQAAPSMDDDDLVKTQTLVPKAAPEATPPSRDTDLMSFDLGSLSLELGEDPVTEPGAFVDETLDPLETKLALADEFRAIGDDDGARALIEEVIAESSGYMKAKAQRALSKL